MKKTLQDFLNESSQTTKFSNEFNSLLEKYGYGFDMDDKDLEDIVTDVMRQLYYSADKTKVTKIMQEFCAEENIINK